MTAARKFTEEQIKSIIQLYADNMSCHKIAKQMECSSPTILNLLRKHSVLVDKSSEAKALRYSSNKSIVLSLEEKADFYVYFHKNDITGEIFYVGKGRARRAYHKSNRGKAWYKYTELNSYSVEFYKEDLTEAEALLVETEQINSLPNLVNVVKVRKINDPFLFKEYFQYSEDSPSFLKRIKGTWTGVFSKGEIGNVGTKYHDKRTGYTLWRVKFLGKSEAASRIIWILFNGEILDNKVIDHIDGNSLNNHISNLRCVTQAQNANNTKKGKNNTSGATGVFKFNDEKYSGYRAIVKHGVQQSSKRFYFHKLSEPEAFRLACEWRTERIKELNEQGAGYTERHGK